MNVINMINIPLRVINEEYNEEEKAVIHVILYDSNDWEKSTDNILDKDNIVITDSNISITYDYPLSNPLTMNYKSKDGFTLKNIVDIIVTEYIKIYDTDEKTSTTCNRYTPPYKSDGIYGIFRLHLCDLIIKKLKYDSINKKVLIFMDP